MIILGVDPGTQITGFGIIKVTDNKYEAVDYGCVRPPSRLKLTDRYLIIYKAIDALIDKYSPEALVVETQFVGKNPQSAIKLGMARGMAIIAAKKKAIPVFEYSPTKAKKSVGDGRATKSQVQKLVQLLLHLKEPPTPEDAADALALAICHANSLKFSQLLESEI